MTGSRLAQLLDQHEAELTRFVARHAGRLTRYESVDDLKQGVHLRVIESEADYEHRGAEAFQKWMYTVARNFLASRYAYWSALRRKPAALLRLTAAGSGSDPGAVGEVSSPDTGPLTYAERRDLLLHAVRALEVMLPRDKNLVVWSSEDVSIQDMADRLEITYAAVEQARRRALDRFRKAFRLATRP